VTITAMEFVIASVGFEKWGSKKKDPSTINKNPNWNQAPSPGSGKKCPRIILISKKSNMVNRRRKNIFVLLDNSFDVFITIFSLPLCQRANAY
jgi:hypothetical protein